MRNDPSRPTPSIPSPARLSRRYWAALWLLVAPSAWAACPVQPHYPLPPDRIALRATLTQLDAQQDQCLRNSTYYAWRGAVQLALGQYSAATESLERALLLQPDLPGAQLDYAQALLAQGDTLAALDLLRLLAQRNDLPPRVRSLLAHIQLEQTLAGNLAAATPTAPLTRWQLSSALGWDSNLNSAPHTDSLSLSVPGLPGTSIALPLERSSQPQPGALALTQLSVQQLRPLGHSSAPSALLLTAQLAQRSTRTYSKTNYQHSELALHWLQAPQASAQWLLGGQYSYLRYGGQPWLNEWQLSAQRQHQWGSTCRASAGAEWTLRRWHASPELNGHYHGLLMGLDCTPSPSPTTIPTTWGMQLRWGHDHPEHSDRPGGRATRTELRGYANADWGVWQLSGAWHYQLQRDHQGYSPLLEQGRQRRTQRHALDLQISRPLHWQLAGNTTGASQGQLRWFIGLQYSQQRSNIGVFEVRQHSIHSGLRWVY